MQNIKDYLKIIKDYDEYTYIHSINVAKICMIIGKNLNLNNKDLYLLKQAALLHDIGKINIDKNIINKPSKLTIIEFDLVKMHPYFGYNLLKNEIDESILNSIYYHHENINGTGYHKLDYNDIPLFAKIIHIADVYDAMISKRAYKDKINKDIVLKYLLDNSNIMFDKNILKTFLDAATAQSCPGINLECIV